MVYEVYKKVRRERGAELANLCLSQLNKTRIVHMTQAVALLAADLSLEFSLPMADAFVLATARDAGARLVTSDMDFRKVPEVEIL